MKYERFGGRPSVSGRPGAGPPGLPLNPVLITTIATFHLQSRRCGHGDDGLDLAALLRPADCRPAADREHHRVLAGVREPVEPGAADRVARYSRRPVGAATGELAQRYRQIGPDLQLVGERVDVTADRVDDGHAVVDVQRRRG